jgi:hypothetical protein
MILLFSSIPFGHRGNGAAQEPVEAEKLGTQSEHNIDFIEFNEMS